jgi:hypothetical protein
MTPDDVHRPGVRFRLPNERLFREDRPDGTSALVRADGTPVLVVATEALDESLSAASDASPEVLRDPHPNRHARRRSEAIARRKR